jgi:hypothetical protein
VRRLRVWSSSGLKPALVLYKRKLVPVDLAHFVLMLTYIKQDSYSHHMFGLVDLGGHRALPGALWLLR